MQTLNQIRQQRVYRRLRLVFMLILFSFIWSIDRSISLRGLIEGIPVVAAALLAAACLPLVSRRSDGMLLAAGLVLAVALVLFEKYSGMRIHNLVGARAEESAEKRSAILLAILAWPALAGFVSRGQWIAAAMLFALAAIGALAAESGASLFGLGAGLAAWALARCRPGAAALTGELALKLLIIVAIFSGAIAALVLPTQFGSGLNAFHADHRIAIWKEFGLRAEDDIFLGHGFNTSQQVYAHTKGKIQDSNPAANQLIEKIHPHNGFLQIWVEFGLVGAVLSLSIVSRIFAALARLSLPRFAPRFALTAFIAAVMLVSHSIWQPWWLAALAAALIWVNIIDADEGKTGEVLGP